MDVGQTIWSQSFVEKAVRGRLMSLVCILIVQVGLKEVEVETRTKIAFI